MPNKESLVLLVVFCARTWDCNIRKTALIQLVLWWTSGWSMHSLWVTKIRHCPLSVCPLSTCHHCTWPSLPDSPLCFSILQAEQPRNEARPFFFFFFAIVLIDLPPLHADPTQWTEDQVYRWAEWTVQEFKLTAVNLSVLRRISGYQLCSFTLQQFHQLGVNATDTFHLKWCLDTIKAGKQVSPKALTKIW